MSPRSVQLKCLTQAWVCVGHRHLQGGISQASLLQDCRRRKQLSVPAGRIPGWKASRLRGTPRTLGFQAYPLPPWVQQGLFKILQQSPQKTRWSVFLVQVWVPPGLLRWRWFTAWTESLSCILTWECVSRGLYLSETLAGSWARQLQTAVTCTSSSLNPSVTHLSCLPQIGHKQLLLQFWKPFLYFTIILLQVIYFSTQFFQLVSQSKPELFRLFHTNTAALL